MGQLRLSVVIPTLNEAPNIRPLIGRLSRSLDEAGIVWEAIFIDDHSTDNTVTEIESLAQLHPVRVFSKIGKRGKAYSLLQGFAEAQFEYVAMLDADLQYPPEAIPGMYRVLERGEGDIVVANRVVRETTLLRRIVSQSFQFFFGKFLHGLAVDVQSGLKVFRRQVLNEVVLDPTPWTFDLEFLLSARNYGYTISGVNVSFFERQAGASKIHFFKAITEIGWNALRLRFRRHAPLILPPTQPGAMIGAGVAHLRQRFVTHTTLHHRHSALHTLAPWQRNFGLALICLTLVGLWWNWLLTGIVIVALLSTVYFIDTFFNLGLVLKSLKTPPEIESSEEELRSVPDETLPLYSILCPLYREAHMLPGFVAALEKLEWPRAKLEVLLLLEENDPETIAAAQAMELPSYMRVVVVPHSLPKTKPKACNYGLSLARGEFIVIYDAEDIPDPWQLRKAYLGFQKAGPEVRCLQAKLNYFNPHQNLLTRFFTAEYSLWFDIVLVGLQSINTSIPLGGTSNHFRTRDLLALEGWDPFNVTEDCDLGVRIFKRGFRTAIIDSVTLEEANSHVRNWLRQRSRWIKGYMQTYLVHMRHPVQFVKENGLHALYFQLVVGGKLAFLFINPILWVTTIAYFTLYSIVGPTIQALYPTWVFYMAAISLVFGNFLYVYYYMIGCAKRHHWPLIKYVFFVPLYWVLGSTAAYVALYELVVKPHFWQKTVHGLHRSPARWVDGLIARRLAAAVAPHVSLWRSLWSRATVKLTDSGWESVHVKKREEERQHHQIVRAFVSRITEGARGMVPDNIWDFVFSSEGILMFVLLASNVVNFAYNAIIGRLLDFEELSKITLINTLWFVVSVGISAFSSTINFRTAYLFGAKSKSIALAFFRNSLNAAIVISSVAAVFWLAFIPVATTFFQSADYLSLFLFTPVFLFGVLAAAYRGFLQGNFNFGSVAVLFILESVSKLVFALLLYWIGFEDYVYASIPLSVATTALFGMLFIRNVTKGIVPVNKTSETFSKPFFFASLINNFSAVVFLSLDILLVNHFFPSREAGQYALLSLVGKMVYFLGTLPNYFTITFVSQREGQRRSSRQIFFVIYGMTALVCLGTFLLLGPLGGLTVPLLFGEKTREILPFLIPYCAALGIFSLNGVFVSYHLAKKRYAFSVATLLTSLALVIGIQLFHGSLEAVVNVVLGVSVFGWSILWLVYFSYQHFLFIRRGVIDFFDIFFGPFPEVEPVPGKKRILIFNWRDIRHRFVGGAEVYVHEMAKQWSSEGHHVTIFSGNDGRSVRHEVIDDIRIVRRGGFYLVYFWAALYYLLRLRDKYDVVIDCENGIPFFTPLYVRKPIICLLHHVHQDVFFHSLPKPLAWVASFLEKNLMPLFYSNVPFVTVSESSRDEMQALGLGKAGITVVYPGVHREEFSRVLTPKSLRPTILYLGRLKAYKSVNVLIQAFRIVLSERPEARLVIAGDGEERPHLERLARELRFPEDRVQFVGHVGHQEKIRLLQEAWALVNPSFMEGWGIVAIEANAAGTPVIASDVPGLRDSVRHEGTGYLVEYGDVKGFADRILLIIRDKELREGLSANAQIWAGNFDWGKMGRSFLSVLSDLH